MLLVNKIKQSQKQDKTFLRKHLGLFCAKAKLLDCFYLPVSFVFPPQTNPKEIGMKETILKYI